MHIGFLTSLFIGVGWIFAILMGIALLAMANFLGDRYVYTQLGVSRMGPKLGKRLPSFSLSYKGTEMVLQQLISNELWTLFVFLDTSPISVNLIPDLLEFASSINTNFKFVVFCRETERISTYFANADIHLKIINLADIDEDIQTSLGIRVLPYALLVDRDARLITKGLVNHKAHLCLLIHNAKVRLGDREELSVVSTSVCSSFLKDLQKMLN